MARDSITWQTFSIEEMKESQKAVDDFYGRVRKCINPAETGTGKVYDISDPDQPVAFTFTGALSYETRNEADYHSNAILSYNQKSK